MRRINWPWWRKFFLFICCPILIAFSMLIPLPYYVEMPGTTESLKHMVKIDQLKDDSKGSYNLTTVRVARANLWLLLYAAVSDFTDVYDAKTITNGASDAVYQQISQLDMITAQNKAIYEAFQLAKKPFELKYEGVYILDVTKNSTFKDKLKVGDVLLKVNNKTFQSSAEMVEYVSHQTIGDPVSITYQDSNQKTHKAEGKIIKLANNKPGIGISLTDHTTVMSTPSVHIDANGIGGPSAGMMFTLEIYDQLTGQNLRQGKHVAGTGTIEIGGAVGRIGGIDKKVAAASQAGADIFFAPDDDVSAYKKADPAIKSNYLEAKQAAKKLKSKMTVVPVKNVQDAIDYLKTH